MFDLIIGVKTMRKLGVKLDFDEDVITIDKIHLPMRELPDIQSKEFRKQLYLHANIEPLSTRHATKRAVEILDAKYEPADLDEVVRTQCTHLTSDERQMLLELLQNYDELFDGTLGDFKTEPVKLELKEGAKPYHGRPFPIPHIHLKTLKKEIQRLCDLGVLEWQPKSEWAAPMFIIPKKNFTVGV